MTKTYQITITGTLDDAPVVETHEQRGFNKQDALLSLYRGCKVNPFIADRTITIKELKNV